MVTVIVIVTVVSWYCIVGIVIVIVIVIVVSWYSIVVIVIVIVIVIVVIVGIALLSFSLLLSL